MDASTIKIWDPVTGTFDGQAPATVPQDMGKEIKESERQELRWLLRQL